MAHYEKTLSTQRIYEGKILALRKDIVELENKNTATREVIEHSGGVAILAIDENGDILLVRQFRYPLGKEILEIPAGKRNAGEDHRLCGIRELEEETGYTATHFKELCQLVPTPAYLTELIYIYYATGLHKTAQNLDDDEFLSVVPTPPAKALEMVLSGEITDSKTQIAILRYMLEQK